MSRRDRPPPRPASSRPGRSSSINGETLKDIDPRIHLGNIITKAEATDGVVKFIVKESAIESRSGCQDPGARSLQQDLAAELPEVRQDRARRGGLPRQQWQPGGRHWSRSSLLFLLSTGEEKDLEVARRWVKQAVDATKDKENLQTIPWAIGYGAPAFCEYYLRTGDESVLPLIKKISDQAARLMYNGAWNHRTVVNFKYGHLNAAGVHCVTFLMLAKECGVEVDETRYRHRSRTSTAMPAAATSPTATASGNRLRGQRQERQARLRHGRRRLTHARWRELGLCQGTRHLAITGFYTTTFMLHGHTGGGIGEIWRSSAMGLLYDKKPTKYREFMDNRKWHYDLSRRFNGTFTVLADTP